MVEREHGAGRQSTAGRDETVAHPAGFEPEAVDPAGRKDADEALYRRLMALGEGVQADFDEALAELAK